MRVRYRSEKEYHGIDDNVLYIPPHRERERERERELYLPQNNTNTVMQRATKNDNVAGCQKRLSPIKLATLQKRQIRLTIKAK